MNLDNLIKKLDALKADNRKNETEIYETIKTEYFKLFEDWKYLQETLKDLENSGDWGADESGFYIWTRFEPDTDLLEYQTDALNEYLSDHGAHWDTQSDALLNYQGECVVINSGYREHDGNVYLSDGSGCSDLIIDKAEYRTDERDTETEEKTRNQLIENWMEKQGYFPAVLIADDHGNVYPVNTQETKGK